MELLGYVGTKSIIRSNTLVPGSKGAVPSNRGPMVVGVGSDSAAAYLVLVALLALRVLFSVFDILGNLSISLGYDRSSREPENTFRCLFINLSILAFIDFSVIRNGNEFQSTDLFLKSTIKAQNGLLVALRGFCHLLYLFHLVWVQRFAFWIYSITMAFVGFEW